jgi:hypothetical protein
MKYSHIYYLTTSKYSCGIVAQVDVDEFDDKNSHDTAYFLCIFFLSDDMDIIWIVFVELVLA